MKVLIAAVILAAAIAVATSSNCHTTLGYQGQETQTVSNYTCLSWDDQADNMTYTAADFPDATLTDASNYCRNPDNNPNGPWCFVDEGGVTSETCGISECLSSGGTGPDGPECHSDGYYFGTTTTTTSGYTCQAWSSSSPHSHSQTNPDWFPDATLEDASNYCRNPDNDHTPWCYTSDPDKRYEYCANIPPCEECHVDGFYAGSKTTTGSGIACQAWSAQTPHEHGFDDPSVFPEASVADAGNKCRNPDNDPSGPWCYTSDPDMRYDYCGILVCGAEELVNELPTAYEDWPECSVNRRYLGTTSTTTEGLTCQRWDAQTPHTHRMGYPEKFVDQTVANASNYCRNPDHDSTGPWCYTTDPDTKYAYCDISPCRLECYMPGTSYDGHQFITKSGKVCQRWDSQTPHTHTHTDPANFPDATLEDAKNYCRSPDGDFPWCYVNENGDLRWEYCEIAECNFAPVAPDPYAIDLVSFDLCDDCTVDVLNQPMHEADFMPFSFSVDKPDEYCKIVSDYLECTSSQYYCFNQAHMREAYGMELLCSDDFLASLKAQKTCVEGALENLGADEDPCFDQIDEYNCDSMAKHLECTIDMFKDCGDIAEYLKKNYGGRYRTAGNWAINHMHNPLAGFTPDDPYYINCPLGGEYEAFLGSYFLTDDQIKEKMNPEPEQAPVPVVSQPQPTTAGADFQRVSAGLLVMLVVAALHW